MEFQEQNGLFVPVIQPDLCRLFVDESYLTADSGTVQAALFVANSWYQREAVPESRRILSRLGAKAKEFKANKLSKDNQAHYEEFLRLFLSGVAAVGMTGKAFSIVTLDGPDFHPPAQLAAIASTVGATVAEYGVSLPVGLLNEFARQLAWLLHHGSHIVPGPLANPLAITFDSKHRYGQEVRTPVFIHKGSGVALLWRTSALLTRVVDTAACKKHIPVSAIEAFDFGFSQAEFGLQAADLFANLYHACLRHVAGARDHGTVLRHALLARVAPALCPDSQVASVLTLSGNGVTCSRASLCSRWQLAP